MSGPIRRQLGPTKSHLLNRLKEAKMLLENDKKEEDEKFRFKEMKSVLVKIGKNLSNLEVLKEKLINIASSSENEAELLQDELDEIIKIILEAQDIQVDLECSLADAPQSNTSTTEELKQKIHYQEQELEKVKFEAELRWKHLSEIESRRFEIDQERINLERNYYSRHENHGHSITVKLPKLKLKVFNGNVIHWSEFWDSFNSSIHNNTSLAPVDKLNYLMANIEGEAKQAIAGLRSTGSNYEIAIQMLKERFGNKQAVIDSHYTELTNLPAANSQTSKIRIIFDKLEMHLRSLEALGEDTNHQYFISMMKTKLPKPLIVKLEEQKDEEVWTVKAFSEKLRNILKARENAERTYTNDEFGHKYPQIPQQKLVTKETERILLTSDWDRKYKKQCIFCENNHWSDECRKYNSLAQRKLKIKGKCFLCLGSHNLKDCKTNKVCYHCKQQNNHHRSICPKIFQSEQSVLTYPDSVSNHGGDGIAENGLLSVGETVLMQTATAHIENPYANIASKVRVLFDTGSQRTYITEKLAKNLKLKLGTTDELSVVTFGKEKPSKIKTRKATINLKLHDGTLMQMTVNVVPTVTGTVQRVPVNTSKFKSIWKEYPLADSLPTTSETSTIELLIGNDYYLDLIMTEKVEISNGTYLLKSKLGWLLSGRTVSNKTDSVRENMTMSLLTLGDPWKFKSQKDDPSIQEILPRIQDIWELDTLGIKDPIVTSDDDIALKKFQETIQYEEGRYHVTWPWKEGDYNLPENYELAYGRLKSITRKLGEDSKLMMQYNDIITDQLNKGIVEKVNPQENPTMIRQIKKHYIPHQETLYTVG